MTPASPPPATSATACSSTSTSSCTRRSRRDPHGEDLPDHRRQQRPGPGVRHRRPGRRPHRRRHRPQRHRRDGVHRPGLEGTFEETPLADLRAQFDVNVFGAAATVQAVLPFMRERRRGHILAVTSMGGLATFPGVSAYCGSKYALEGILEALGKEVAGFNIHVTAIEPGSFRTDWAGRSMIRTPRSIPDYDEVFEPIRAARQTASGNQLGNPAKAAAALLRILDEANPPAHLVLGSDALRLVRAGRETVQSDLDTWEDLTLSTDYTPDDAP
ncbi:oxidoreductase [Sphaerisporangium sp. NPDC051017]|uniref:oxidoreductase n=1 Tax=Sphaerisporangium sp. NPDC051017 TaxID=3154636 RepID=UPI0034218C68